MPESAAPAIYKRSCMDTLLSIGRPLYALAIVALGVETLIVSHTVSHALGEQYNVLPVLPWLPAIPALAWIFSIVWTALAIGLFIPRALRPAGLALGALLLLCAIFLVLPKYLPVPASISMRTVVFETISLAAFAFLIAPAIPVWLAHLSRWLLAVSLIVFGWDHFPALVFIANLLPHWIPWHMFWVAFFGAAMIAAGIAIGTGILRYWGAALIGLMFALYVLTLHLPRVAGWYGIPNAPHNPDEWSSFFIALAFWGGCWAVAERAARTA